MSVAEKAHVFQTVQDRAAITAKVGSRLDRQVAKSELERLQAAYLTVANLVTQDPVYVPIFERLEAELAAIEVTGDAVRRAKAITARHRAIA